MGKKNHIPVLHSRSNTKRGVINKAADTICVMSNSAAAALELISPLTNPAITKIEDAINVRSIAVRAALPYLLELLLISPF